MWLALGVPPKTTMVQTEMPTIWKVMFLLKMDKHVAFPLNHWVSNGVSLFSSVRAAGEEGERVRRVSMRSFPRITQLSCPKDNGKKSQQSEWSPRINTEDMNLSALEISGNWIVQCSLSKKCRNLWVSSSILTEHSISLQSATPWANTSLMDTSCKKSWASQNCPKAAGGGGRLRHLEF